MSGRANENQPSPDGISSISMLDRGHLPPITWKQWGEQAYTVFLKTILSILLFLTLPTWSQFTGQSIFLACGKFRFSSLYLFLILNLPALFPTISPRNIREGLHPNNVEVSSLVTTAHGSGWFLSAVCTGTRHHHQKTNHLTGASP